MQITFAKTKSTIIGRVKLDKTKRDLQIDYFSVSSKTGLICFLSKISQKHLPEGIYTLNGYFEFRDKHCVFVPYNEEVFLENI